MNLKNIQKAYELSLKQYNSYFLSKHWKLHKKKKEKLFTINNLKNFRNNNLSNGLDGGYYSKEQTKKLFEELIKKYGLKNIVSKMNKKNFGNYKNSLKIEKRFIDSNQLFHVKWLNDLNEIINFKSIKTICEIGAGYGCFAEKLINSYNSKYLIIDLPEANFLSSYYLKKNFPQKKFLLCNKIYNLSITASVFKKYDIVIVTPWHKLKNFNFDLIINARSMMEMDYRVIKKYFNFIHTNIGMGGYFLNINRYEKKTVGYPIEFSKYPYDKKWKVEYSKNSWKQNHMHTLLCKRIKITGNIKKELNKINILKKKNVSKIDKFYLKNILPNFLFVLLQKIKNYKLF